MNTKIGRICALLIFQSRETYKIQCYEQRDWRQFYRAQILLFSFIWSVCSIHRQFFILFSWTWFPCLISRNHFLQDDFIIRFLFKNIWECTEKCNSLLSFSAVTAWWLFFSSSWFVGVSYDLGKWGALSAEHQDSFLKGPVLLLPTIFFTLCFECRMKGATGNPMAEGWSLGLVEQRERKNPS